LHKPRKISRPTTIAEYLSIESLSTDQLLSIVHPNSPSTSVITITILTIDPVAALVNKAIVGTIIGLDTSIQ
ncbi:MAG: hypothetical protein EZS28_035952, partial [Streblomastix strix]